MDDLGAHARRALRRQARAAAVDVPARARRELARTARSTATSSRSARRSSSECADVEPYPTYSVVIPIHNEQESLQELQRRLVDVFPLLDGEVEVLFVDDGSTDLSYPVMLELHAPRSALQGHPPRAELRPPAGDHRGHRARARRRGHRDGRRPPASARAAARARRAVARGLRRRLRRHDGAARRLAQAA